MINVISAASKTKDLIKHMVNAAHQCTLLVNTEGKLWGK